MSDPAKPAPSSPSSPLSRRGFLAGAAAACAGATGATGATGAVGAEPAGDGPASGKIPPEDWRISKGRIRQSIMAWCYKPMPMERLIDACHRLGFSAMEGISTEHYPRIRELGMEIAIVGSHGFRQGPADRSTHALCLEKLRAGIDLAAKVGSPNVITFTGSRPDGVSAAQASRDCVECWKRIIEHAEAKGVNLCLEHLNSRDVSHPMKGHAGYFGDDVDHCIELIRKVDSPRMKLLFDIYHVQIMNGDVIRRIREYHDLIGHYHTAGVPGRGEIDETQELNYPAILEAIVATGYRGFVAQEYMPTWSDKLAALRHGARVMDV